MAIFPLYDPPGLLRGVSTVGVPQQVRVKYVYLQQHVDSAAKLYGGTIGHKQFISPSDLARVIAKIGHAFAVAEFGLDLGGFTPLLRELIRGLPGTIDTVHDVFGAAPVEGPLHSDPRVQPIEPRLNVVSLAPETTPYGEFLVARVQLFAAANAPTYLAVVGRRENASENAGSS